MKIMNLFIVTSSIIVFTGCATTAGALKNENVLNNFTIDKNYKIATEQLNEMLKVCSNNKIYNFHKEYYPTIEKSSISLSDLNNVNYYYNFDFEKINENKTRVISYTYQNNEYVRTRVRLVENWLKNDSKDCREGF